MSSKSGQRFIKENRVPRVHIEYELETYGAKQKVELPFIMGVMSDLSGKSTKEKVTLSERTFDEFDMDNFERKMKDIAPRAAFVVDNTLGDGGKMGVDLTFSSLDDFTPANIAQNVPALAKILEARNQLRDLLAYMDGKNGAQELLDKVLRDPDLMKALASAPKPGDEAAPEDGASA